MRRRAVLPVVGLVLVLGQYLSFAGTPARLAFGPAQRLPGAAGGTEPQLAVAPDGTRYAISGANTTASSGSVLVYRSSSSGGSWAPTPGQLSGIRVAGADVDIKASTSGRLVALEQDGVALSFVVNHSDDRGRTWKASTGLPQLVDTDRPWLAAGPSNTMYLLFHNGFSSNATHNMYVETSRDGGASFGAPVPVTLPGTPEFADLQCADSGGPSALLVNPRTGRLYAVWGSRHGPLGGCGLLPLTPFTLVPDDRVWVATSATGALGSWTAALGVDESKAGNVVGMQLTPASLDRAGNVWIGWTTPPRGFPDDSGAGISVRRADALLQHWSTPLAAVPPRQPGAVIPQLVAGDPGRIALLYMSGRAAAGSPRWYPTVTTVLRADTAHPQLSTVALATSPSYKGTATDLMGSGCDPSRSPVGTVENNPVTCARSADVMGMVLDRSCRVVVTWPSLSAASNAVLGAGADATFVATQSGGPALCATSAAAPHPVTPASPGAGSSGSGSSGSGSSSTSGRGGLASTGLPALLTASALLLLIAAGLARRRAQA